MKYLILTASTGEGHNQAANNLKNEIEKNGDVCIVIDLFKKNNFKFIEKGYEIIATAIPDAYGALYKLSDNKFLNKFLLKNVFMSVAYKIKKKIEKEKPDIIISTHPFSVPIIARVKRFFKIQIPFIQIVTDFKAHYTYVDKWVDAYITASDYTKESLIKRNIKEDKIYVFGIPIKDEFKKHSHTPLDDFNILIMGGSMGVNDMEKALAVLTKSKLNIYIDVVCGRNENLRKKLAKKFTKEIIAGTIKIHGFVNNISEIMDKSKLLITKPGGLTSSEAISKNIPMIIPFYLPGQEKENTSFLVESNVALEIKNINTLPQYIEILINDVEYYNYMVSNMKKLSKGYSTTAIIELSKKLVLKEKSYD